MIKAFQEDRVDFELPFVLVEGALLAEVATDLDDSFVG